MKTLTRGISFLLLLTVLLRGTALAGAETVSLEAVRQDTQRCLLSTVPAPQPGQVGGEWVVLALARLEAQVPEGYYDGYRRILENQARNQKGVLHARKYSEYARTVLALTALGLDPTDVVGYDLLAPLGDYEQTLWQGIMGPVMALLALDSGRYEVPQAPAGKTQASRELYVEYLLDRQLPDGGFALSGETGDTDVTAMALQALAKYQGMEAVEDAVERALNCLSSLQGEDGGYHNDQGVSNLESTAQVVIALCELGIAQDDARFVKGGHTVEEALLSYRLPGGGFSHTGGGERDAIATEQAFVAIAALIRQSEERPSLYRMIDAAAAGDTAQADGLPGKDPRVRAVPVTLPGKSFPDIQGHPNQNAIESLAARGILNGKNGGVFDPDNDMIRAEFTTLVVKALGMEQFVSDAFTDVPPDAWYAETVGAAHAAGLIDGVGDGRFDPLGKITRQQAAVLVERAAALCGLQTATDQDGIRDVLSPFPDHKEAADWAESALAFCYRAGILSESDMDIRPRAQARRCEVAEMVWRLLERAALTEGAGEGTS